MLNTVSNRVVITVIHPIHPSIQSNPNIDLSIGSLTTIEKDGTPVKQAYPTVEPPPTWVEYYRELASALAGKGPLPASGKEAREVIRIIELVQESSKLGRTLDV